MPTATLTFRLPDEADEHRAAVNAGTLEAVLIDVDVQLRNWLKHGHEFGQAEPDTVLQAVRDLLRDEVRDHGVEWVWG